MTTDRFNELNKDVNPTLRMELDNIRNYLGINNGDKNYGKACVMIGSGFSKNADRDVDATMKDWTELGRSFYVKLYGVEPTDKDLIHNSPIKLASMVEASFGRAVLDKLIFDSLPDERFRPNSLYKELLELPWRDVFTTNYDRLLETSKNYGMNRFYNEVTNKETLIYEESPRIIKLHGSFPDIHPYIITEEDFRTYPVKYPEFVNTVRQALIENLFCLIGFSGDDPNFLSWVGWLRDVMGRLSMPIYCVTNDPKMHGAQIELFKSRNIEFVNLAGIRGITSYREGLEFFIKYIGNFKNFGVGINWRPTLHYKLDDDKQIEETIKHAAEERHSYPGWLVLPENYFIYFQDGTESFEIEDKIGHISNDLLKINLLFEFDWRLFISLTPRNFIWYVKELEKITVSDLDNYDTKQKKIWLLVSLLNIYRHSNNQENYCKVQKIIEKNIGGMSDTIVFRYYNEICLNYLSRLQYEEAYNVVRKWAPNRLDYKSRILKATILKECGYGQDAVEELEDVRKQIRSQRLSNNKEESRLQATCMQQTSSLLKVYEYNFYAREGKNEEYHHIIGYSSFINELRKEQKKPIEHIHGFNLHSHSTSWNMGESGFVHDFLYSYRYLDWKEESGYPFGTENILMDSDSLSLAITKIIPYEFEYGIASLVRSCNSKVVNNVLTRNTIALGSRDEVDRVFSTYLPFLSKFEEEDNKSRKPRIKNCFSILAKLSIKAGNENVVSLFKVVIKCLKDDINCISKDDFKTIYSCLTPRDINNFVNDIYTLPFHTNGLIPYIPFLPKGQYVINQGTLDFIKHGLKHEDKKVSEQAYLRLKAIFKFLTEDNKNEIKPYILEWRNKNNQNYFMRESYHYYPYEEAEAINIINNVQKDIDSLNICEYKIKGSSEPISRLNNQLKMILPVIYLCDVQHKNTFLTKISKFLDDNEDTLKKNDSDEFFGGLRHISSVLMKNIESCISNANIGGCNENIIRDLASVISRYCDYGFTCTYILTMLENKLGTIEKVKEIVIRGLFSGDFNNSIDLLTSLLEIFAVNFDKELMEKIESYIEFSNNDDVSVYINFCTQLVHDNIYPKERLREILSLLLNIRKRIISSENKTDVVDSENEALLLAKELVDTYNVSTNDKAIAAWKEINESEDTFNDVRLK